MTSVPFELEYVEFGMLILGIFLPEKSQKECGQRNQPLLCFHVRINEVPFAFVHSSNVTKCGEITHHS